MLIRPWKPDKNSGYLLDIVDEVLAEYTGMRVTLRQLYYQLVTRNAVKNEEAQYKRVAALVTSARYAGLVGWDAVEDRTRQPRVPQEFRDVKHLVEVACQAYELDYWAGQAVRPEVWIEKEALANVMEQAVRGWHATVVVNRGYASASSLYDNAERLAGYVNRGQRVRILYLGDHDPSGLDMVRDVRDRLAEFLAHLLPDSYDGNEELPLEYGDLEVEHVALTDAQIKQYNPPPNPTKVRDSRAAAYIERYGYTCWELDALPPKVLRDLVVAYLEAAVDDSTKFREVVDRERAEIEGLKTYAASLKARDEGGEE